MQTFRFGRRFYAVLAISVVIGIGLVVTVHRLLANRTPLRLSTQNLVGRWKGSAFVEIGTLGKRHIARVPVEITFGQDGKLATRAGLQNIPDTQADYAIQKKSLILSHIFLFREGKVLPDSVARHASIVGSRLTLRDPDKPKVVLYRD